MANLFSFFGLIIAITIHEFAHAYTADRLGDPTPRSRGRVTLNPLAHLDPLGTIMILFARFGWGKPVPIDPYNFSKPRRDEIIVSLAGPISNLFLALILAFVYKFFLPSGLLFTLIVVNVSLGVFNLLPVPPLDGSKIFLNILPLDKAIEWQESFDKYGFFILALLLFLPFGNSNLISIIITPIIGLILRFLVG